MVAQRFIVNGKRFMHSKIYLTQGHKFWAVRDIPILLGEVEQEQRPSGNEDREAIVVGAGLCDGEGERAYTAYAPHYDISGS